MRGQHEPPCADRYGRNHQDEARSRKRGHPGPQATPENSLHEEASPKEEPRQDGSLEFHECHMRYTFAGSGENERCTYPQRDYEDRAASQTKAHGKACVLSIALRRERASKEPTVGSRCCYKNPRDQ
jgi:hypothetical protein